jgi:hypothetical protein
VLEGRVLLLLHPGDEDPALILTHAEPAAMVGLSRPRLNARLRALQNEGWVELRSRRLRVLDADGLRATALGPASAGASARRAS